MEKIFNRKVALITGASFGIGRAAALAFARRGARLVLADVKQDPEQTTAKLLESENAAFIFVEADVSDSVAVQSLIAKTIDTYGCLNFAFNNAGIEGEQASTHACSEANWDRTMAVNLKGVWLCMKYEIAEMLKTGGGVIVNCSSVAGLQGFAHLPAYVASKHGLIGLTKSAALEYATSGIRVIAVCPGVIKTPMVDRVTQGNPEIEKQYTALEPVGRMGRPEEVAETVAWLCSDQAGFITGIALPVDGGLSAG